MQLTARCRELILQHLDLRSRAVLRQVSRQARQAVHEVTRSLTINPTLAPSDTTIGLPAWLPECCQLQRLSCWNRPLMCDLRGLPSSLQRLKLTHCSALADFSPLLACTGLRELELRHREATATTATTTALALVTAPVVPTLPTASTGHAGNAFWSGQAALPSIKGSNAASSAADSCPDLPWVLATAPVLSQLTSLTSLCLAATLTDRHAAAAGQLAEAIGACTGLRHLQLTISELDHAAMGVAAALPRLQHLTHLSLYGSWVEKLGIGWLAPCLPHLTALHTLDLRGVLPPEEGHLIDLLPGLRAVPSLRILDLRQLDVDHEMLATLLPSARVEMGVQKRYASYGDRLHVLCDEVSEDYYDDDSLVDEFGDHNAYDEYLANEHGLYDSYSDDYGYL